MIYNPKWERVLLEGTGAERVEAEALAGMDNSQFPSHGQDRTLAGSVGQLRGGGAHQGDEACRVDDTAGLLVVAAEAQDRVFATEPHTLDVDALSQIPDLLGSVNGIRIIGVHDTGIVEDDIGTTPGVHGLDHRLHVGLLGHIAADSLQTASVGDHLLHLVESLGQSGL